jgi:catechol 2,3-dioxygenase-like lactoylglutathione lyase family enzyme
VITGAHTIVFAEDAEAARAFFRDVLELPNVDAGDGWLIFKLPPGELACHPTDSGGHHQLYFMCDDIEATRADLAAKGVEVSEITDAGFGRITSLQVPGAGQLDIYEPRHPTAYDLPG